MLRFSLLQGGCGALKPLIITTTYPSADNPYCIINRMPIKGVRETGFRRMRYRSIPEPFGPGLLPGSESA